MNVGRWNIFIAVRTIVKAYPSRVFHDFISEGVAAGIDIYLDVIFLGYLLKMCEEHYRFIDVLLFIVISMLLIFGGKLYLAWYDNRYIKLAEQVTKAKLDNTVFRKAINMDVICYENPYYLNHYRRSLTDYYVINSEIYAKTKSVVVATIMNLSVIMLVITIDPVSLLFGVIPILAVAIFGKKVSHYKQELKKANVLHERKAAYVERTICLKEYAKELRMFRIYAPIKRNFDNAINQLMQNTISSGKKIALLEFVCKILFDNIMYFGLMIYLSLKVVYVGEIHLADWLILVNSVTVLSESLQELMEEILDLKVNSTYMKEFRDFFEYAPQIPENQGGRKLAGAQPLIEFKNVSFSYEGSSEAALKKVNLVIRPGEKIAIVGCNGAGKTTLVKLLLRLYDPDDGCVLCDGLDCREYFLKEYRECFGTALQDSKVFALSIAENVLAKPYDEKENETVEKALKLSGLKEKVATFDNGINSNLTKEFDDKGVVLSGGETQKLVLSRVFAGNHGIIVLDEPSCSLDPIAEKFLFDAIFKVCTDKSMVLISHRLANVVAVDRIYVMDNGMIVEEGKHEDLISQNGIYADMFKKQAEYYIIGKDTYNG